MTSKDLPWTDEDEERLRHLLAEVRRKEELDPNGPETEADGISPSLLNQMMVRRRVAANVARSQAQPARPSEDAATTPHSLEGSQVPKKLQKACRNARYEIDWLAIGVDGERQTVALTVDQPSEVLGAIFNMAGLATSAFITAHNPFGNALPEEENKERHEELVRIVKSLGLRGFSGRGRDPEGLWPAEESLLIVGLCREAACTLGAQLQQNAILFAEEDFIPRVVLLR